jgi:CNT family concentrative nucleoside transporter
VFEMNFEMGFLGVLLLLAVPIMLSTDRKAIRPRTVLGALGLQIGFAFFVLYSSLGKNLLQSISDGVSSIIHYASDGVQFIFGDLANFKVGFIFAIHVLPVVIFFSSFIAVLYHFGIMQLVIRVIGGGLQKLLKSSQTESLSATANIFVGHTEAPLLVRPYLNTMTDSELFAIMTGGLASIAGTVLAGYAQMGVPIEVLVAASFMSAPGGLLMAKLMHPETKQPNNEDVVPFKDENKPINFIEAAANGAASGVQLAINIGGMLLAFIGLISLFNGLIGGLGDLVGLEELSLQGIFGYVFAPVAFLIGVPWNECVIAGSLIGQKLIFNEFIAFQELAPYLKDIADGGVLVAESGAQMSARTQQIMSFALCGFANFGSIAILLGGIGSLAPSRRRDIARLGIRAVIAGTLSNLMSATIAGLIFLI